MNASEPTRRRLRIVLFEDNSNDVELICWTLEKSFDCQIVAAKRLDDYALEIGRRPPPDMIICDGCDVYGEIALGYAQTRCPESPFVICSGNEDKSKHEAARIRGIEWVVKDASFETLVATVARLTSARSKSSK